VQFLRLDLLSPQTTLPWDILDKRTTLTAKGLCFQRLLNVVVRLDSGITGTGGGDRINKCEYTFAQKHCKH